jgi:hypothetical protein
LSLARTHYWKLVVCTILLIPVMQHARPNVIVNQIVMAFNGIMLVMACVGLLEISLFHSLVKEMEMNYVLLCTKMEHMNTRKLEACVKCKEQVPTPLLNLLLQQRK